MSRMLRAVLAALAFLAGILAAPPAALAAAPPAPAALAAVGDGSPSDPNIAYAGRWNTSDSATYTGGWAAPYIRAAFTGRTVKIKLRDNANIYVSIDNGPDVFYAGVRGTVDLTPTPLASGTHTIRVFFRIGAAFQGFVLDSGARTVAPAVPSRLIEYVGDSITFGATSSKLTVSSYSRLTSDRLGADYATIARSGACLVESADGCFGLSAQYFKDGVGSTRDWDFTRYRAAAVVINLGTNDVGHAVTGAQFGAAYTKLLRDVRATYPNAALFAFQTFRKRYLPETAAAVTTLRNGGDRNVHYVNTDGWLTDADYTDGGHPNDTGHQKIADRLAPVISAAAPVAFADSLAAGDGSPSDPNITYTGRWDTAAAPYASHWTGAYLRTRFTGTTVKLRQRNSVEFWASVDGKEFTNYKNVRGTVDLTPTKLAAGTHTLVVSYRQIAGSYTGDSVFGGLVLDAGATTMAPQVSPKTVEFIGDSITAGSTSSKLAVTSYGWLAAEKLGVEHTQIAQGGACLVETADGCVGLSERFTHLNAYDTSPAWDFNRYRANAVVINLGTNDVGHGVHTPEFQAVYTTFLATVRAKYPQAAIFALQTFRGRFVTQTRAAVQARNDAGDRNVYFVNTDGWIPDGGLSDSVHPNDLGHRAIADRLAPIIGARI
ncbi:GDSL-type esterase/lipase family protein [Streptomyces sp. NPDC088554]|uniref:GDSL-type esterase/lipase family protein n=1 Tax=Streptomyces sp. NPDC088554 TaxID=3365865 RepID=UPI003820191D